MGKRQQPLSTGGAFSGHCETSRRFVDGSSCLPYHIGGGQMPAVWGAGENQNLLEASRKLNVTQFRRAYEGDKIYSSSGCSLSICYPDPNNMVVTNMIIIQYFGVLIHKFFQASQNCFCCCIGPLVREVIFPFCFNWSVQVLKYQYLAKYQL